MKFPEDMNDSSIYFEGKVEYLNLSEEGKLKVEDFFKSKEHKYFESASLIPDDKTLLLTVAGMVPFKSFFLGEKEAPFKRITTYQKCILFLKFKI